MMPSSVASTQSSARQAAVLRASRAQARRTAPLRGARFDGGARSAVVSDDEEQDDDVSVSDNDGEESFDDSAEGEDGGTGATEEDTDESKGEDETEEKEGEKEKGEGEGKGEKEESDKKDGEEGKEKSGDAKDEKDGSKTASEEPTPSDKAAEPSPQGAAPSREQKAAELATAHAQARRQQVSGVPEAAAPTQNERGERMAPSATTQDRQAREQSAQARGESQSGRIAQARAKLQEAKEAYKEFGEKVDAMRNIGSLVRSRLDQFFLSSVFAFPLGTLLAAALLHGRVIASVPGISNTRFGFFRFTAKNVFEMLPNSKKMRPFTFTPITGFITAGIIDTGIVVALLINFIITFFPYIVAALGIGIIFDAGMRELFLSFVGF